MIIPTKQRTVTVRCRKIDVRYYEVVSKRSLRKSTKLNTRKLLRRFIDRLLKRAAYYKKFLVCLVTAFFGRGITCNLTMDVDKNWRKSYKFWQKKCRALAWKLSRNMDKIFWTSEMASPVTRLTHVRFLPVQLHKVNCCNTSSKYDTEDEVHKRQNTPH